MIQEKGTDGKISLNALTSIDLIATLLLQIGFKWFEINSLLVPVINKFYKL